MAFNIIICITGWKKRINVPLNLIIVYYSGYQRKQQLHWADTPGARFAGEDEQMWRVSVPASLWDPHSLCLRDLLCAPCRESLEKWPCRTSGMGQEGCWGEGRSFRSPQLGNADHFGVHLPNLVLRTRGRIWAFCCTYKSCQIQDMYRLS